MPSESVTISTEAKDLLEKIVPGIEQTTELIEKNLQSSQEQHNAISQKNSGMNQLNQIAQENAASSEQLSATAESLKNHVHQVK